MRDLAAAVTVVRFNDDGTAVARHYVVDEATAERVVAMLGAADVTTLVPADVVQRPSTETWDRSVHIPGGAS